VKASGVEYRGNDGLIQLHSRYLLGISIAFRNILRDRPEYTRTFILLEAILSLFLGLSSQPRLTQIYGRASYTSARICPLNHNDGKMSKSETDAIASGKMDDDDEPDDWYDI
jgi:hypothetical protein